VKKIISIKIVLLSFLLSFLLAANAQENDDMFVKRDFLILLSTKSYSAALTKAKQVAASQHITLDLRGLSENKSSGLSFSKQACEEEDMEYPSYYARGREDGVFVSIEYSNAYREFAKGYYIVVAASGSKEDNEIKTAYNKLKGIYKDAYFKSSKVYMGCMH
jgi:hypothetical protein